MELEYYLKELSDGSTQLKVSGLMRLSALTGEEAELLASEWPKIDVRRRRRVVQELLDIEEDNVELNFDAVLLLGLEDSDAEVRLESVRGLWEYESPDL